MPQIRRKKREQQRAENRRGDDQPFAEVARRFAVRAVFRCASRTASVSVAMPLFVLMLPLPADPCGVGASC
jgi:hypothetical protein